MLMMNDVWFHYNEKHTVNSRTVVVVVIGHPTVNGPQLVGVNRPGQSAHEGNRPIGRI